MRVRVRVRVRVGVRVRVRVRVPVRVRVTVTVRVRPLVRKQATSKGCVGAGHAVDPRRRASRSISNVRRYPRILSRIASSRRYAQIPARTHILAQICATKQS